MSGSAGDPPRLDVVIEIPRGSLLKRGSTGALDFVSPVPCPFNYGSVPNLVGGDDDLLDAVVLGPRLARGTQLSITAHGAVGLLDRGIYDDKLICAAAPPGPYARRAIVSFFVLYAAAKRGLNLWRGQRGPTRCEGWGSARDALGRATPRPPDWRGPSIAF
ncbi:MAG: inorganic diphosphatase [Gammaproteobacteria bacterium]